MSLLTVKETRQFDNKASELRGMSILLFLTSCSLEILHKLLLQRSQSRSIPNKLVLNPEVLQTDGPLRLERVPVRILLAPAQLRRNLVPELAPDTSHPLIRHLGERRPLARYLGPLGHHLRHGKVLRDRDSHLAERRVAFLKECLDDEAAVGLEVARDGQDGVQFRRENEVIRPVHGHGDEA